MSTYTSKTHYPPPVPEGTPVAVTRDNNVLTVVASTNAAFEYIQHAQHQSVDWACRYEGWSWRAATGEEVAAHARRGK